MSKLSSYCRDGQAHTHEGMRADSLESRGSAVHLYSLQEGLLVRGAAQHAIFEGPPLAHDSLHLVSREKPHSLELLQLWQHRLQFALNYLSHFVH